MRYVAAALLVGLAGGDISAAAIEKILKAAGVDADSAEVSSQDFNQFENFTLEINYLPQN